MTTSTTTTASTNKIVAYYRVSTKRQGITLKAQQAQVHRYAAEHGLEIIAEIEEKDSGRNGCGLFGHGRWPGGYFHNGRCLSLGTHFCAQYQVGNIVLTRTWKPQQAREQRYPAVHPKGR